MRQSDTQPSLCGWCVPATRCLCRSTMRRVSSLGVYLGVKGLREALGGDHDAGTGHHEFITAQKIHAVVFHRRNRWQGAPDLSLIVHPFRSQRLSVMELEDDLRCAPKNHLSAHVNRLLLEIAENVA